MRTAESRFTINIALLLWVPISLLLVFTASYVGTIILDYLFFDTYTDALDVNFWVSALVVLGGYLIAFLSIPAILLSRRQRLQPRERNAFFATALGVIGLLLVVRLLQDTISRIDCGNSCTSEVLPSLSGAVLSGLVFAFLLLSLGIVMRRLSQKAS